MRTPVTTEPPHDGGRDAFTIYCTEINRVPLLTAAEEAELARRVKRGDATAREKMITANLRFVVHIARHYEGLGLPLLDLISEGNIGLMKAVDRFDPSRGVKLSSYAAWWIKQAMRRALANDSRAIRVPVHLVERIFRLNRAENRLAGQLGRTPSDEELGDELGMSIRIVKRIRAAANVTVVLEHETDDEHAEPLINTIPDQGARPGDELERDSDIEMVSSAFASLSQREAFVLHGRFGLSDDNEQTLRQLSQQLGLTGERVRQLEKNAVGKLRRVVQRRENPRNHSTLTTA